MDHSTGLTSSINLFDGDAASEVKRAEFDVGAARRTKSRRGTTSRSVKTQYYHPRGAKQKRLRRPSSSRRKSSSRRPSCARAPASPRCPTRCAPSSPSAMDARADHRAQRALEQRGAPRLIGSGDVVTAAVRYADGAMQPVDSVLAYCSIRGQGAQTEAQLESAKSAVSRRGRRICRRSISRTRSGQRFDKAYGLAGNPLPARTASASACRTRCSTTSRAKARSRGRAGGSRRSSCAAKRRATNARAAAGGGARSAAAHRDSASHDRRKGRSSRAACGTSSASTLLDAHSQTTLTTALVLIRPSDSYRGRSKRHRRCCDIRLTRATSSPRAPARVSKKTPLPLPRSSVATSSSMRRPLASSSRSSSSK